MRRFKNILLNAFLLCGITVSGRAMLFSQTQPHIGEGFQEYLEKLGQESGNEEIIKCGFPIASAARHIRDSLGVAAGPFVDRILQRDTLQKSIVVGAFRIHYDTVGVNTPALLDSLGNRREGTYDEYADSVGAIANYVRTYETIVLGYDPPPSDQGEGGGDEYDIYIVRDVVEGSSASSYGLTTPEIQVPPGGIRWTSYIRIHNDFTFVRPARGRDNRGLPALRVTLAHEFHHAIQMGAYGLWSGHEYFYEITSTWLEDVLYTDVNDYDQYLPAHFNRPDKPFTAFEFAGVIQYARCIWGHYIARRFDRDAMRHAWEAIRTEVPLQAMDNALQTYYQSTFRTAFAEWTKWNYFTGARDSSAYYPEGAFWPETNPATVFLTSSFQGGSVSVGGLGAEYFKVVGRPDTLVVVVANANFDGVLAGNTGPFEYLYYLSDQIRPETPTVTPVGLYFGSNVPDPDNWFQWFIVGKNVSTPPVPIGAPFPNPLIVGGASIMKIPVESTLELVGTLTIFTSSMDLIYSSRLTSVPLLSGQQAFAWNGVTNRGNVARTGIYYFVLDIDGREYSGKFALVRK